MGPVDLSHRKLAHRGSYINRVWVSPSTVDRVLARHGLRLKGGRRHSRSEKKPWPEWTEWRPNQLWCWDGSQFERCVAARYAYAIIDIVSRKWMATILASEATGTQVRVLFLKALEAEGLVTDELLDRLADLDDTVPDDDLEEVPLLLAISDIHTRSGADRCSLPSPWRRFDRHRRSLVAAHRPTGAVRRPLAC